jgi:hypothetical protein
MSTHQYWKVINWMIIAASVLLAVILIASQEQLRRPMVFGGLLGLGVRLYLYVFAQLSHRQDLAFSLYGLEYCCAGLLVRWSGGPLWLAEILLAVGIAVQIHILVVSNHAVAQRPHRT